MRARRGLRPCGEQIVTSALNALATHLAGLGASRKTLVVVSEGFSPAPRRRGDESLPTLESVIRSANRAGASIYPIDPRGLVAPPGRGDGAGQDTTGQDALLALANDTGGRAVLRSADLADDLSRIAREASSYYLITFQSEREADGRFHALDVKVRRPGIQLRVRKGYWATLADSAWRSRLSTSAETARPPGASPPDQPADSALVRALAGRGRQDARQLCLGTSCQNPRRSKPHAGAGAHHVESVEARWNPGIRGRDPSDRPDDGGRAGR